MSRTLDLSLGPVQPFVAAARRTRDLWSGSYLLSLLTASAIAALLEGGAAPEDFAVPAPAVVAADPLVARARGSASTAVPAFGSLPNHLRLAVDRLDGGGLARVACERVRSDWAAVASAVWERFVDPAQSLGSGTRATWERQVAGLWELVWVVGDAGDGSLLARRKLWRTHLLPEEPGDRCTTMPEFQELSGWQRLRDRPRQDEFWDRVRTKAGDTELRDGERLCAPALIKRLWPRLEAADLPVHLRCPPEMDTWPSTWHLAFAPWVGAILDSHRDAAEAYLARLAAGGRTFKKAQPWLPGLGPQHPFWSLGEAELDPEPVREASVERRQAFASLPQDVRGRPARYFAVVQADGDRLGQLVGRLGPVRVGEALADFGNRVPEIASRHHARVVYAGGDDVLALAAPGDALGLADALATAYAGCFGADAATLSAAVVFAHEKAPLVETLSAARELLEQVAKEENGRGSVVVSVRRRAGETARWVAAFRAGVDGGVRPAQEIAQLADDRRWSRGGLSSSALRRIYSLVATLCDTWPARPGDAGRPVLADDRIVAGLVRTELERGPGGGVVAVEAAELAARLARSLRRQPGPEFPVGEAGTGELIPDALLVAEFLAEPGSEGP